MTVATFVARMRIKQAALFSETGVLMRSTGDGTFDPDTASYAADATETIYTGAALVRPQGHADVDAGETTVLIGDYLVKLPVDTDVRLGDVFLVATSTYDAGLVNRGFRAVDVPKDGWQISRRVGAVDQTVTPS